MKSRILGVFASFIIILATPLVAVAGTIELVITGNGSESVNEVATSKETNTTVHQSNNTSVDNDINIKVNTGDNEANDNTGEVEIKTGDAKAKTEVVNELNNSVVKDESCCESKSDTKLTIENNGEGSHNNIDYNQTKSKTITVNHQAEVSNKSNINANTGGNKANSNGGNVKIDTGNAYVQEKVSTITNLTSIRLLDCCDSSGLSARIKGNGDASENNIRVSLDESILVYKTDYANIENHSNLDANTGDNSANKNMGDVVVTTGDAIVKSDISTIANLQDIIIGGCIDCPKDVDKPKDDNDKDKDKDDKKIPVEKPTPPIPTEKVNGKVSADKDKKDDEEGKILGVSDDGRVLPITGSNGLLLMILANIMMFLLGCYFRLRSGRSPDLALALVK